MFEFNFTRIQKSTPRAKSKHFDEVVDKPRTLSLEYNLLTCMEDFPKGLFLQKGENMSSTNKTQWRTLQMNGHGCVCGEIADYFAFPLFSFQVCNIRYH